MEYSGAAPALKNIWRRKTPLKIEYSGAAPALKKLLRRKTPLKIEYSGAAPALKKEIVENFETAPGNSKIQNFGGAPPGFF